MPTKYKRVEILCTPETMSETLITIIDNGRRYGCTYCNHQVDEDPYSCSLFVVLKKEEPDEEYVF